MSKYPNASALPIAFNVPIGSVPFDSNLNSDSLQYVTTLPHVSLLSLDETDRIDSYVHEAVLAYLERKRIPKLTELKEEVWSLANIGDAMGDRTLWVVFDYLPMVEEEFLSFVQGDILRKFPEWRVVHCEDSNSLELNLAIYPDAISIGHEVFENDFSAPIAKWRQDIFNHREPSKGPLRRQLAAVQRTLRDKSRGHWKRSAPTVLMAFDNDQGDFSVQSIWILVRGGSIYDVDVDSPDLSEGLSYSVLSNGKLDGSVRVKSPTRLWMRQVVLPKRAEHRLTLSMQSNVGRIESSATVSEFARDCDLVEPT